MTKNGRISVSGEITTWQGPSKETSRHNDHKRSIFRQKPESPKSFLNFFSKTDHFFQLPAFCLTEKYPDLTALLLPWTISLAQTIWTLKSARTNSNYFLGPKNDSNYLDVKLKVFKKKSNRDFRLVQNNTMGESCFIKFVRLRNQLARAAKHFG